ncbi:MAG: cyclic nucleotide-binding domain-containing protein [Elusimicrobiota bacterium]
MPKPLSIDDDLAELLKAVLKLEKFFPKFGTRELLMLFPHSGLFRYAADEPVIKQGEASRDIYILKEGSVAITRGGDNPKLLATLVPPEIFGEIALVREGVRVANAVALEQSAIFRLSYPDIQALVVGNPPLAEHLENLAKERS